MSVGGQVSLHELLNFTGGLQHLIPPTISLENSVGVSFLLRGNGKLDVGVKSALKTQLNCRYFTEWASEVMGVMKELCDSKHEIGVQFQITQNKLDRDLTRITYNNFVWSLNDLPTCPPGAWVDETCDTDSDCQGDPKYGHKGYGFCKSINGLLQTTQGCLGTCIPLKKAGERCDSFTASEIWKQLHPWLEADNLCESQDCLCGTCTDDSHKLAIGEGCSKNADCKSGYCLSENWHGTTAGCLGKCAGQVDAGGDCSASAAGIWGLPWEDAGAMCSSGTCICDTCTGYDRKASEGSPCASDDDCFSGGHCEKGHRVRAALLNLGCGGVCRRKAPEGSSCHNDASCISGECTCGTCGDSNGRVGSGNWCRKNRHCKSDQCGSWWHVCTACNCYCRP